MSGADRIPQLERKAREAGVEIHTETRGTELILNASGKVVGARAVQTDGGRSPSGRKGVGVGHRRILREFRDGEEIRPFLG
jgi:flavin-dependent dehydrogenase